MDTDNPCVSGFYKSNWPHSSISKYWPLQLSNISWYWLCNAFYVKMEITNTNLMFLSKTPIKHFKNHDKFTHDFKKPL